MPFRFAGPSRNASRRLAIICLIGLLGCQPAEQVSRYTAPKDPIDVNTISDDPKADEPEFGVLGAIASTGRKGEESWYFFKFQPQQMGEMYFPKALARHKEDFEAFLKSVKFHADGDPTWTLPKGWRKVEVKTALPRIATFRMKKSKTVVDLAVSEQKGSLLENINRWRVQQTGLEPITETEIETKCQVLIVDGRKVILVDISGPGPKPVHAFPK